MKKYIRVGLPMYLFSLALYFLVYVFISFVHWELKNPFQWIIELPTMNQSNRSIIAWGIVTYMIVYGAAFAVRLDLHNKNSKQ